MLRNSSARSYFLVLAAIGSASASLWAAAPSPVDIPARGALGRAVEQQVERRMEYWLDQLRDAKDEKNIRQATKTLLADYFKSENLSYRYIYAAQMAAKAPAYLAGMRESIRQINLAVAVSGIDQVSIQPALGVMVAHTNPAVRYLGWHGYRSIRMLALAQGPSFARKMYESLSSQAGSEESGPVLGEIFRMLTLPPIEIPGVPAQTLANARGRFLEIAGSAWPKRCRQVLTGNAPITEACRNAVIALNSFAQVYADDEARRTTILQMAMDLAYCSARAYDDAKGAGELAAANEELLRGIENLLNNVKGTQNAYLLTALTDPNVLPPRGVAVRRAVVESWLDALKADGVVKPEFKAQPRPSSNP